MIYRLVVPGTIEDAREVRVLEWHGIPGSKILAGALIVELETHKALIEVTAGQAGVLRRILCDAGTWCPLQGVLAVLSDHPSEPLPDQPDDLADLAAAFTIG